MTNKAVNRRASPLLWLPTLFRAFLILQESLASLSSTFGSVPPCGSVLFACSPPCSQLLINAQKHPSLFSSRGRMSPVKAEASRASVLYRPRSHAVAACSLHTVLGPSARRMLAEGGGLSLYSRCSFLSSGPSSHPPLLLPRHEAQRLEQEARGRLERQKILDQSEAEKARKELLELEAMRWVKKWR